MPIFRGGDIGSLGIPRFCVQEWGRSAKDLKKEQEIIGDHLVGKKKC